MMTGDVLTSTDCAPAVDDFKKQRNEFLPEEATS